MSNPELTSSGRTPARAASSWPFFVATFFVAAGGGLIFPLLAELQDAHGLPTWGLGVISAMFFAGAVSGQLLLAPYADRGRARGLLLVGVGVTVVSMVAFALSSELWQFSVARLLSGLGAGAFLPAVRATLVRADPSRAGHLLGRLSGVETAGFVFGPVIGTLIFELGGLSAPFLVMAAALSAVAVVLTRTALPEAAATDTDVPAPALPPDRVCCRRWPCCGGGVWSSPCCWRWRSSSRPASTTRSGRGTCRTEGPEP